MENNSTENNTATTNQTEQTQAIRRLDYDGSLIHDRFGYQYFKESYDFTGNLLIFRGKMEVTDNLIDKEDLLNKDYIYSDDAINFCWEIPGADAFGGVAFQRLFVTYVGNYLGNIINEKIIINGDDILVPVEGVEGAYKKASVSISTCKNGAVLGHLGINISAGSKAPSFAYSTNMTDEQVTRFTQETRNLFYSLTKSIALATTKTVA